MNLGNGVGPVRVNAKPIHVAHDEERWVLKGYGVLLKLGKGSIQVFTFALVLPSEMMSLPDICPAVAAGCLRCTTLEAIPLALGVGISGRRFIKKRAQVIEMRLRRRALLKFGGFPFGYELLRCHGAANLGKETYCPINKDDIQSCHVVYFNATQVSSKFGSS